MIKKKRKLEDERHYFVDEAGDLALFNKKGKVIIGNEGCSKYFILGTALIEEPHAVRQELLQLQQMIVTDPYLNNIPSVLNKTKVAFHAKDDCPEVRMQVYKLLKNLPIKVYAIIRRKSYILEEVRSMNRINENYRFNDDAIYDDCVKRLFKDRLHLAKVNHVMFARRGKSSRNESLKDALLRAKANFEKKSQKEVLTANSVISNYSSNEPALQVIDYYLWALQRMYERHEERYYEFVKDKFTRIIDLDDKREEIYGVYYDERNPLNLNKIKDSLKS
ncbi:MAG: DUF3800 domain-containing protein [Deltaproteobacteria bacterium]|nr:DUF3800 domain-containing protein [Deltaproteobacteria bacterium]